MDRIRALCALLAAMVALGALGACSYVDPQLTEQSNVFRDAPVYLSDLGVYVRPQEAMTRPLKAIMFPLRVTQQTNDPIYMGQQFAKVLWNKFTSEDIFSTLAYDRDLYFRDPARACAQARMMGADIAVVGEVPYFLIGASTSDTSITVRLLVLDAKSGRTIVSLEQSGRLEVRGSDDYIWFQYKTRMPESPIFEILNQIGDQMAFSLKSWSQGIRYSKRYHYAYTTGEIVQHLTLKESPSQTPPAPNQPGKTTPQKDQPLKEQPLDPQAAGIADTLSANTGEAAPSVNLKIEFDFDSDKIRPESLPLLDQLGRALLSPKLAGKRVAIIGHTDSEGEANYNMQLSQRRAMAVKKYLMDKFTLPETDLVVKGLGEAKPLVPNTSPANRAMNRRVEVQLL